MQSTALRIRVEGVDAGAHHELALVRLRHVDVHRVAHHDAVENLLVDLTDERLQGVGLDRHSEAGHRRQEAGATGGDEANLAGSDRSTRRLEPSHATVDDVDVRHLTALDDVHSKRIAGTTERKDDSVVTRDAAATLERRAHHWVARLGGDINDRAELFDGVGVEPLSIHTVEAIGIDATNALALVMQVVGQIEHATLREEDVVIELFFPAFPELERVLVHGCALVPEVVRANDRRVAHGVAVADPAALDDRDVRQAMILGEVVRGREAMQTATDDDGVIRRLRLRVPPEKRSIVECVFVRIHGRSVGLDVRRDISENTIAWHSLSSSTPNARLKS